MFRCFVPASLRIDSATLTLSSPSATVDPTSVPGPSTTFGSLVALHPTGTGLAIMDGTALRWFLKVNGTWVGNASVTLPPPFAQPLDVQAAAGRVVVVGESCRSCGRYGLTWCLAYASPSDNTLRLRTQSSLATLSSIALPALSC